MNKLDYIDMKIEGGSITDLFSEMAKMDAPKNFVDTSEAVELKATTIRLPVELLEAYDAVLANFGLTRQDTFAHMVNDFIASSIAGYVKGMADYVADNGIKYDGINTFEELIGFEYNSVLTSITNNELLKNRIDAIAEDGIKEILYAKS